MLYAVVSEKYSSLLALGGILFAFVATVVATVKLESHLPKDAGREFAHDGKLSAGKPRGAGIIFVLAFTAAALLFTPLKAEIIIYLILIVICMMTGFLDDASKMPWGEFRKGFLDLCVAALTAMTFLKYNSNAIELAFFHMGIVIPKGLFAVLAVILVWVSVNVTNCSDGVDGLSGTLAIISMTTIYLVDRILEAGQDFSFLILLFAACILGYLWYNATPSRLLMGDAGSRAMGLFISIAVLKTGRPLLYIPVALVLILDGGLGLIKVSLLRMGKIRILKKVRTPLHDHVRKIWGWSNTQTVFRFAIIQIILAVAVVYGIGM
ncbi:phospho-N-acetylmuramoyl-pentapeptide-transferase [Acetatifactor muris]|jgi:phospho-N-acetylmuramoyl-pentapeptide-transferase|uniref:Phospho-N-acetylmuramoyl-pentapeptide-transferase n=1 Tax=Acetatifactor muris TaxID=879566 RepID=A0A2K4ZNM3_9FIRM|nr:phospho-N-acetylmuramoyl-pentapeptide-transferase [Acetatifactor muris]MCI8798354.1 phospho-N-acetylmuramoyl-pentapeptide-transferase [Lachnospiraceae bacterium]MCR2050455.1 phospho-N-acetylmuramoyl-pentapeptide-transferase [Acetatifactor muris]SOY32083.1 Phospho-N-acetylmuramoyl-pentapeptide-transferase [Acetatifactor muris]